MTWVKSFTGQWALSIIYIAVAGVMVVVLVRVNLNQELLASNRESIEALTEVAVETRSVQRQQEETLTLLRCTAALLFVEPDKRQDLSTETLARACDFNNDEIMRLVDFIDQARRDVGTAPP